MKILVLDLETGNYDPDTDNFDTENCMICEIGVVSLDTVTSDIKTEFDSPCREDRMCHPYSWVFSGTSLTYDEVEQANTLDKIRSNLQALLDQGIPVTSWNHSFDFGHLEYPKRGFTIPTKFWDPMIALTNFFKIPSRRGDFKWPKVAEAYNYFYPNIPYYPAHRAIDDAKVEADLIYKAVKKWPILVDNWMAFL